MASFATRIAAVLAAGYLAALPAQASDEAEAAAAMQQMLDSQGAVLDTLEAIEDAATLERHREALSEALAQARSDTEAVADHAEVIATARALQAVIRPQIIAYNARRKAVHAEVSARLDAATLDMLDEIFDGAD